MVQARDQDSVINSVKCSRQIEKSLWPIRDQIFSTPCESKCIQGCRDAPTGTFWPIMIILYIWKPLTDILADKSKSKVLDNFWEPEYKNKSLTIISHVPNTIIVFSSCFCVAYMTLSLYSTEFSYFKQFKIIMMDREHLKETIRR